MKTLKKEKLVHDGPVETKSRPVRTFFRRFKKAVRDHVVVPVVLTAVMFTVIATHSTKAYSQTPDNGKSTKIEKSSDTLKTPSNAIAYQNSKQNGKDETLISGPNNEPMRVVFTKGYTGFQMGTCIGTIENADMAKLGVTAFDGNERDFVVQTENQGNVHFILNKNWAGVLVFKETGMTKTADKTYIPITVISTTDGSKVIPETVVKDVEGDGLFAVATDRGIILFYSNKQGYLDITKAIGVKKLETPQLKIKTDGAIKIVEIKTSNYPEAVELACD